tara:strand:+ start:58 stop:1617 length:1560 start_codon:yes stop_codon:yes gene_type:complete
MGVQINGSEGNVIATKGTFSGDVGIGGTLTYEDVTNIDSVGLVTARSGIEIGASPGVAASISVDGNAIFSGITTVGTGLSIGDNVRANFGDGGDLKIYHDGSHSRIDETGTGNLMIQSNNAVFIKKGTSENIAIFNADGAVELYYDGTKHFETVSAGLNFAGTNADQLQWQKSNNLLKFRDGTKAVFGEGDDLEIFHDGSNSIINDAGTGQLQLQVGGSTKFNTQSGGVQFYGSLYGDDNNKIELGNDQDLKIYHNGSYSVIDHGGTGHLYFESQNNLELHVNNGEDALRAVANGTTELYWDNLKRLSTVSYGIEVHSNNSNYSYIGLKNADGDDVGWVQGWSNGTTNEMGFSHSMLGGSWALRCDIQSNAVQQIYIFGHTYPSSNNTYNLGNSSYRWGTLYASNATNTSDKNLKNTITDSDLGLSFINKLRPVSYKWNQKEGENLDTKTHYGLISQDVEETVIEIGKTLDDFGAIDKPDEGAMGLSYNEFISPLIKSIQELSSEVETLKAEVAALKSN